MYVCMTFTNGTAQHDHLLCLLVCTLYCYVLLFVVGLASLFDNQYAQRIHHLLLLLLLFSLSLSIFIGAFPFACVCVRATHTVYYDEIYGCESAVLGCITLVRGKKWAKVRARMLFFSLCACVCVFCRDARTRRCKCICICVLLKIHLARFTLVTSQMRIHTIFFIQLCCISKRYDFDFVFRISYIQIKKNQLQKSQHTFSLVYILLLHCVICVDTLYYSLNFIPFCFYFYFDVYLL